MSKIPPPDPGPFNIKGKSTELRTLRVKLHGKVVMLYSIGYLSAVSGKCKRALRTFESRLLLPRPLIKMPSNIRFYLADEVYQYGTIIKSCAPRQGQRSDLNPLERQEFKELLAQARDRVRAKMNKDIQLINAEMKNDKGVVDLANLCRVNRKMKRLVKDIKRSKTQHETNT